MSTGLSGRAASPSTHSPRRSGSPLLTATAATRSSTETSAPPSSPPRASTPILASQCRRHVVEPASNDHRCPRGARDQMSVPLVATGRDHVADRAWQQALALPDASPQRGMGARAPRRADVADARSGAGVVGGDVVSFPRGKESAHQISNRTDSPVRVLMLSSMIVAKSSSTSTPARFSRASRTKTSCSRGSDPRSSTGKARTRPARRSRVPTSRTSLSGVSSFEWASVPE